MRATGGRRAAVAAAGAIAAVVAAAGGAAPVPGGLVDLRTDANVTILGAAATDETGTSVAPAGDVNGDGRVDIVVGAPGADANGRADSGSAYVLFGGSLPTTVDLAELGSRGFRIDGAEDGDTAGYAVAGAGDVNGDGRADVVVGAPGAEANDREDAGAAYVVFGGSSAHVDLGSLGRRGFRVAGAAAGDYAGFSVARAGDMNRDGRMDVVLGAPALGRHRAYAAVVYGRAATTGVDLAALGSRGFRIDGVSEPVETEGRLVYDETGLSVANAGDVNGDGRTDLVIGSPGPGNGLVTGNAYVLFTQAAPKRVDLGALGTSGIRVMGEQGWDFAGESVAAAGDVNRDGLADIVTGATGVHEHGVEAGAAYVVFGRRTPGVLDLESLGDGGFRIDGAAAGDLVGWAVGGVGNVGGDSRPDVIVGSPEALRDDRGDPGAAFVVFGEGARAPLDLLEFGPTGFRIDGAAEGDAAGAAVATAGDQNADGQPDLLVGAPGAGVAGRPDAGAAYVVFPSPQPQPTPPPPPPPVRSCVVPGLRGKTLVAARTTLARRACGLGKVTRAFSAIVRAQRIISQRPKAGATLPAGAKVSVTVSRGRRHR